MYADPSNIRDHVIKLRLNDNESELIDALVNYTGQQKAALLRDLLVEQARLVIVGGEQVRRIAQRDGRNAEDVATELVQAALARRVRRRTGKGPAKVYGLKRT